MRLVAAMFGSVALLAVTAGNTLASFQTIELSVTSAAVGDDVSVRIEISEREGTSNPSELLLVDKVTFDASHGAPHCEEMEGASVVGEMTWQAATIEFQGASYPGFVGTGAFTVPDIPIGTYVLAETRIGIEGTGCHPFTSFNVGIPDTAMSEPTSGGAAAFVLLIVMAVAFGFVRASASVLPSLDDER
jgi:hypothetical protein